MRACVRARCGRTKSAILAGQPVSVIPPSEVSVVFFEVNEAERYFLEKFLAAFQKFLDRQLA